MCTDDFIQGASWVGWKRWIQERLLEEGGRRLSWRGVGGGRRGHTLLPRPRAGVRTGRALASLIKSHKQEKDALIHTHKLNLV